MGLQLPRRAAGNTRRGRRIFLLAVLCATVVLMAGCSSADRGEWKRLAMPEPVTEQGQHTLSLWQGAWIAALITGVIVWSLIFYSIWHFRRRSDDEIPIQTRYNLPLEIFYTIAPVIMIIVFFKATVDTQNLLLDDSQPPDQTIEVTGQQWQWTFNYPLDDNGDGAPDRYAYEVGTANYIPTLVLPVNELIRFNLHSPDVIHDFGVPGFLIKMDVVPGRVNHYNVTPTTIGTYSGKCYELCGVYHSRMIFTVKVVSQEDYVAYLGDLVSTGHVADQPLLGGDNADTPAGLVEPTNSEGAGE
ncbi:MAG: cytochrome c oxidase, subunit [Nocardioides sp.]|nr:cytochrome c oxidase, subunit [Nocardioides sp.]